MLRLDAVTLAPGGEPLLLDADWHVHPGEHVGLVGRNGTGKTTLLRAIVGELPVDGGRIHLRPGARIGWLPQQAVSGSHRPVWDEVSSRMAWYHALQAELDAAVRAAEAGQPGSDQRVAGATERFRAAGGYAVDETIGTVLSGLGFGPDRWRHPCDTFSGGWQMRIALARLLLAQPDLALLDEPTNHLDLEARTWLANYLQQVPWTFVVVSHDRWLLDRAVDRIGEIRGQQLHTYVGNFSRFVDERAARLSDQASRFARQQEEIARLERFIERFGAKATKASQARSRQNALDRMERIDAPERLGKLPKLRLPEAPAGELEAVGLRDAALGWGDTVVVEGVTFDLERGMRLALLGPNGVGKSTLLHALAGRLPPLRGRRRVGDRSRIGVFTQDLAQDLPGEPSGLAHVATLAPTVPPQQIRATLGALGLAPDAAERPIRELSGGEKARVALAALAVRPHNVLLLDEPTNHLDAESVAALVDALQAYAGAVLLVTHDRWLVERVATHVARIADGRLTLHPGVRPDDFEPPAPATGADAQRRGATEGGEHVDRKRNQRERERVRRRIQELEREISTAEAALARMDEALYQLTDFQASRAAAQERAEAAARVDALYAEWEGLEARLTDD